MSTEPNILVERKDAVAVVTLNRPAARNCLTFATIAELREAFENLGASRDVHSIVLAAHGPAFCSGHDLKELTAARADADGGETFFLNTMQSCSAMMQSIVNCPKPVIAAVQGIATAAGCQLVASCDLAVAAESVKFATPGVNIGFFCSTPMVALSRNLSRKHAMEMLLTGDMIDAETARQWGLVNRVVPAEEVMNVAMTFAEKIASKSSLTVAIGKEAFYRQLEMPLPEAYAYASRVMTDNMLTHDAEEGVKAFFEKRPPCWKGE